MRGLKLFLVSASTLLLSIAASAKKYPASNNDDDADFLKEITFGDTLSAPYKALRAQVHALNLQAVKKGFNGTVLVGYKGKLLYEKSFGYADRSASILNTPVIPTQVASISKTFTAMAIMWLVDHKKVDIKKSVQTYLPSFPYENITVEMLLSHRSGLQEYMDFAEVYYANKSVPMSNQDVLDILANKKLKLNFTPDTKFKYCNTNYVLLAMIIEKTSEKTFREFLQEKFFTPLNMKNTFIFDPSQTPTQTYAKGYKSNLTLYEPNYQDGVVGDKGVYTTAEDLYRWDQALYSNKLISKNSKEIAYYPHSPLTSDLENYGLGWRMNVYPNLEKMVYHTGLWHGYQGILSRHIKDNFTVIILSNRYIEGVVKKNSQTLYKLAVPYLGLTDYDGTLVATAKETDS